MPDPPARHTYQLVRFGPSVEDFADRLGGPLKTSFAKLGLNPDQDLEVITTDQVGEIDWRGSPVGVWFGGEAEPSSADLKMLDRLQAAGAPVLPLVADIKRFTQLVPKNLWPINGRAWDDDRVVGDILRAFRLTRDLRQAFISYRRIESQRIADAIFDILSQRGYHVFLDIASVEATERFQDVLWDSMANMDLLILLDSPNALTSRWVNDELVQVNHLGLGILQLIWPGHVPKGETAFCTPMPLNPSDFIDGDTGPAGCLTAATVERVAQMAESVRIESLAARRLRVVGNFVAMTPGSFRVEVQPVGPLVLRSATARDDEDDPVGIVLPIVGLPDAMSLHREHMDLGEFRLRVRGVADSTIIDLVKHNRVRVVYDGLGVRAERARHLVWLNDYLPLRTVPIDAQPSNAPSGSPPALAGGPVELVRWLERLGDPDRPKEELA